jgi:hypothetical protein
MSPECAAGEFETCCHVPRSSSSGSEVDPSAIMAASTPWTSRRDDLCPPAGKFVGTWEYPSGNAEEHPSLTGDRQCKSWNLEPFPGQSF